MGALLTFVLIFLLVGTGPGYPYPKAWGFRPHAVYAALLVVVLGLIAADVVPWSFWAWGPGPGGQGTERDPGLPPIHD